MAITIKQIALHRNGITGVPFHAVLFHAERKPKELAFASVFPEVGAVSVVRLDMIEEHGVTFGQNSWRGDYYEPELRTAIAVWEADRA